MKVIMDNLPKKQDVATKRAENLIACLSLLVIVLFPLYIYALNNRFFYIDDKVADYIPKMLDIARIIKGGEYPVITTNLLNGSVYSAEFQQGIFNPVILLSALLLDIFDNLALGACILTILYLMIAFKGYYLLAVELGVAKAWANIYAVSVALNCYFIYWCASAWFNPVPAIAFFPYALWASLKLSKDINVKTSFGFLLACYLVVSSGWPSILVVLAGFFLFLLLDMFFIKKNKKILPYNFLIYIGTGLVCSIPVLPLLLSSEMFSRASTFGNSSNFLGGSLRGLLLFSFPHLKDFMHTWAGYKKLSFNTYYAAWYALPLLIFLDFKSIQVKKSFIWILLTLTGVFGIITLGPETLGPLRFPIRMLQYYHIFGLLLVALLVQLYGTVLTQKRIVLTLCLFVVQAIVSLQVNPEDYLKIILYLFALVVLTLILFNRLKRQDGSVSAAIWALLGTILFFFCIYSADYHGRGADWNVPRVRSEYSSLNSGSGYVLFHGGYLNSERDHSEYRPATTGLIWNDKSINGYTPLGNKYFRKKIIITDHGNISAGRFANKGREFFEVDKNTGLELLELMKVDKIISWKGELEEYIRKTVSDKWVAKERRITVEFNHSSSKYPGLISWLDDGLEIIKVKKIKHRIEEYHIKNYENTEKRMVFARLWWPGYLAKFDGKEIVLERYSEFLISLLIPPGGEGVLSLAFYPPGFSMAMGLSVIGLLLIVFANLIWRRHSTGLAELAGTISSSRCRS